MMAVTSLHRPTTGICTDGAHSIKHGITQYRGVDLITGKELFYRELGNQTVNIGEFLGKGIKAPRTTRQAVSAHQLNMFHLFPKSAGISPHSVVFQCLTAIVSTSEDIAFKNTSARFKSE